MIKEPSVARPVSPALVVAVAVVAGLLFAIGINRAWHWDESATIGKYVVTPHLSAPIKGSLANHVLLSVPEAVMYRIAGTTSEPYSRILPIAAAVTSAALLAWLLARRVGSWAAIGAVLLFITNPVVFETFRQVRGYSLMTLCAVLSTGILLSLLRDEGDPGPRRLRLVLYAMAIGIGIGAHLYMLLVVALQVVFALTRNRRLAVKIVPAWIIGMGIGLLVDAFVLMQGLRTNTARGFRPTFPVDLTFQSLGGQLIAVVVVACFVVTALAGVWRRREVWAIGGTFLVMLLVIWLVFQPTFLYARFFVWVVPGIAVGVAYGAVSLVNRGVPVAAVAVAIGIAIAAQLVVIIPSAAEDEYANREAASVAKRLRDSGARVCTQRKSDELMLAYEQLPVVQSETDLANCDAVIVLTQSLSAEKPTEFDPGELELVRRNFPNERRLEARNVGSVFARVDSRCLEEPTPSCWPEGQQR